MNHAMLWYLFHQINPGMPVCPYWPSFIYDMFPRLKLGRLNEYESQRFNTPAAFVQFELPF